MPAKKKEYVGWSYRGRPFSPSQYKKSALKKNGKMGYGAYLEEYGRQYKKGYKM